jgi:hypothetical protein
MPYIELGEWRPDTPQHIQSTISDLSNMMPNAFGYDSVPSFEPITGPIIEDGEPAKITGSRSFISSDGIVHTFAGTDKALYMLGAASWVDISAEGGYNGLGNPWQFEIYGNYVLATNYADKIQLFDLSSTEDAKFEVMSETAPRCRTLAIVNEFLMLGNVYDSIDGERPGRIWWGPIADPRGTWTPDQTTMCDYQDLAQGVNVVRIIGGESAKIFMRTAVIHGVFVGSPLVFQFETVEPARGCVGINALDIVGDTVYFLSSDGFYALTNGNSATIGLNKLDKYVLNRIMGEALSLSQCAVDYRNKVVWWAIPAVKTITNNDNLLSTSVLYHYPSGKWGKVDKAFVSLHGLSTKGYTLDELDEINEILEQLPFPLDSVMYKGGIPVVGCFDEQGRLCYGYGLPMDAYVITGDAPFGNHDSRTFVRRVRPTLGGTSKEHMMSISGKQTISDEDTFTSPTKLTRIGDFACRKTGRYHKIRFDLKGDWTEITGYAVTLDEEGTQ